MKLMAWMILESNVCILITRRRKEMQYWADLGCVATPLYALPSV
jgi:hypothetical protein